jgi:uncharacterized protein YcfJ
MNKPLVVGLAIGAIVVAGATAVASYRHFSEPEYARVVNIKPIERTIRTARKVCHEQEVSRRTPVCETVYDTFIERHGFDVRYQIGDRQGTVRMDHDPGDRIPLSQGQLVLAGLPAVDSSR